MATPHKHAALIKQWADDPRLRIWFWSTSRQEWRDAGPGDFFIGHDWHMAVGPKPTQPPRKMCVLGGVEFPMPIVGAPPHSTECFMAGVAEPINHVFTFEWDVASPHHGRTLASGLVHLNREAAEQHSRALLAANKQAIEAAK